MYANEQSLNLRKTKLERLAENHAAAMSVVISMFLTVAEAAPPEPRPLADSWTGAVEAEIGAA